MEGTLTVREAALAADQTYALLKHYRRRFILTYLNGRTPPVSVEELARTLGSWEDRGEDGLGSKEVRLSLIHVHVPKLVAAGLVEYDADRQVLTDWSPPMLDEQWLTEAPTAERR